MNWTKRKHFTYAFKGRLPRALLWNKWVYELWFVYALEAVQQGGNIPREFGDLRTFKSFEEWWRHPDYGFELFCEPYERTVEIVDEIETDDDSHIYLKISKRSDKEKLIKEVARLLRDVHIQEEYSSRARFQPSVVSMKNIKQKQLRDYLKAFQLKVSGMTTKQIAYELGFFLKRDGQQMSVDDFVRGVSKNDPAIWSERERDWFEYERVQVRKAQRYLRSANKILSNVQQGIFP